MPSLTKEQRAALRAMASGAEGPVDKDQLAKWLPDWLPQLLDDLEAAESQLAELDHALDKWRHGAPAALAQIAARRMEALDEEPTNA